MYVPYHNSMVPVYSKGLYTLGAFMFLKLLNLYTDSVLSILNEEKNEK